LSQSKKAAKSVFIIIIFTFGSKILGFIREALIAAKFGSGAETDTFFIALTAITLFTSMITKAINTTTIPVLSKIESEEGKKGKKEHTNNLLNITSLLSFIIIILAWFLSPFILKVLAYGFSDEQFKLAVLMMRIGLPAIFFSGLVGVFRGYLQSELLFTESAAANFPFNFVYIFFLVFLSGIFGIKGLMVASVLAIGAQILIQIPGVKKLGFKYKFKLDIKDKYVKSIVYLIPPVLISAGIDDLNKVIDKSLASTLAEGSISALNYGNRLNLLVTGIFISAITTVIFPMLSTEANKDDYKGLKKVTISGINIVLLITIPATVGMILLADPLVRLAFQRGAFDNKAVYMTVGAVIFYTVGLVGMALKPLLNNIYYSLHDTKIPMINGLIAVLINIILNLILIRFMAHRGLALATSVSAIITSLLLLQGLRKKIGHFGLMKSVKCGLKSLVASAAMGIVVYLLYGFLSKTLVSGTISDIISLLCTVGAGVLTYLLLIYLFKVDEINWVIRIVKGKIFSRK